MCTLRSRLRKTRAKMDIRRYFSGAPPAKPVALKATNDEVPQKPAAPSGGGKSGGQRNTRARLPSPSKRKQAVAAVVELSQSPRKLLQEEAPADGCAPVAPLTRPEPTKTSGSQAAVNKRKRSTPSATTAATTVALSPAKGTETPCGATVTRASPRRIAAEASKKPTVTRSADKSPAKKALADVTVNSSDIRRKPDEPASATESKQGKKSVETVVSSEEALVKEVTKSATPPRGKRRRVKVAVSSDEDETQEVSALRKVKTVKKTDTDDDRVTRKSGKKKSRDSAADAESSDNDGNVKNVKSAVKKKRAMKNIPAPIVVSDSEGDDEPVPKSEKPEPRNSIASFVRSAAVTRAAGTETQSTSCNESKAAAMKETSASEFFGATPVQHVKPTSARKLPAAGDLQWDGDADGHDDDDFQMALQQLDEKEVSKKGIPSSSAQHLSNQAGSSTPTLANKLKDLARVDGGRAGPEITLVGKLPNVVDDADVKADGKQSSSSSVADSSSQLDHSAAAAAAGVPRKSPRKTACTGSEKSSSPPKRVASRQTPKKECIVVATGQRTPVSASPSVADRDSSPATPSHCCQLTNSRASPRVSPAKRKAEYDVSVKTPVKKSKCPVVEVPVASSNRGNRTSPPEASVAVGSPEVPTNQRGAAGAAVPASPHDDRERAGSGSNKGSAYRAYLMRPQAPRAPGSKEIPEGNENCFEGLTFVITGVLESLHRDEAKELIERYGGKVTTTVSKRTNYVVEGEGAGDAKMQKVKQLGTSVLTEDGLLELLRTLPGKKSKFTVAAEQEATKEAAVRKEMSAASIAKDSQVATAVSADRKCTQRTVDAPARQPAEAATIPAALARPVSEAACSAASRPPADLSSLLWVDKYKPKKMKDLIGQQGDRSNAKKLLLWLQSWHKNRATGVKPVSSFGRFGGGASDTGAGFRAALLSGPPGVGKTTTAQIVCQEAGFSYFELNASDTRSRLSLQAELSAALGSHSIAAYSTSGEGGCASAAGTGSVAGAAATAGRMHCVLMDEVDGMAGNEDRGGLQELVALIKTSHIPIICMCNDRNIPKMRTLANYCFDLRFQRPRVDQIKAAMMSIAYKEGLKVEPSALNDIIHASNQDVRQVIHNLSMYTAASKSLTYEQGRRSAAAAKKDTVLGPFEVCMKVFGNEHASASFIDKSDLFFYDYNLAPLFVQENYLISQPSRARDIRSHLHCMAKAADSIADGDVVSNMIRRNQSWNLLPVQAVYSSVLPGEAMRGHISKMVEFPKWLGRSSTRSRFDRTVQELHFHMRLAVSADRCDMSSDYLPALRSALTAPLVSDSGDTGGVEQVLHTMEEYSLQRDDYDSVLEMTQWPHTVDPRTHIPSKVKAAFTRAYNKEGFMAPYSTDVVPRKSRTGVRDTVDEGAAEEGTGDVPVTTTSSEPTDDNDAEEDEEKKELEAVMKLSKVGKTTASRAAGAGAAGKGKRSNSGTSGRKSGK